MVAAAPLGRRHCPVVDSRRSGTYTLFVAEDPTGPPPKAGQFYMLASADRWSSDGERPYLPRAFSVAEAGGGRLGFLVDVVGPGTERLAALAPGEDVWVTGPLGRPFELPAEGARPVLVGGGIGTAPLAVLEGELIAAGAAPVVLLGFRDALHIGGTDLFRSDAGVATEDGHMGARGYVTELLAPLLERGSGATVYACGPPPMLEAVRALCAEHGVASQLAMEAGMACGFGACMGCVVPTRDGYLRLCVDGPIVAGEALDAVEGVGHG